ncbi:MAG TPA: hypothetical protein VGH34_09555 [Vicinamibacterales bacterium]|jgi:serine/threonine protein kinase
MRLHTGEWLGPYEIASLLGVGGGGEVYKAFDPRLDRIVAIKIPPAAAVLDSSRRAFLKDEGRAISGAGAN